MSKVLASRTQNKAPPQREVYHREKSQSSRILRKRLPPAQSTGKGFLLHNHVITTTRELAFIPRVGLLPCEVRENNAYILVSALGSWHKAPKTLGIPWVTAVIGSWEYSAPAPLRAPS